MVQVLLHLGIGGMSELPRFDEQFPAHPLSMARELLRSIARQLRVVLLRA